MFVNPIKNLDKTRFGINFKAEDIKCKVEEKIFKKELFKKVEEDPKYDEKKAKLLLRNFVEKHPNTIARKTQIMLDHFNSSTRFKI